MPITSIQSVREGHWHHSAGFKGFDAIVDAAGNGDYTTIQAAVTAGAASILVVPGTYTLTADITMANDQKLTGINRDTCIVQLGEFKIVLGQRSLLERLRFTGTGTTAIQASADSRVTECRFFTVGRVDIASTGTEIISNWFQAENALTLPAVYILVGGSLVRIVSNQFDATAQAIAAAGATREVLISGNIFSNRPSAAAAIIALSNPSNLRLLIVGNVFNGVDARAGAIDLAGSGCVVQGNTLTALDNLPRRFGILFRNGNSVIIDGNTIAGFNNGIQLGQAALVTERLVVANNRVAPTEWSGIFLLDTDDAILQGNIVSGAPGYGINISNAACDRTIVSFNNLVGNTTGGIQDLGTGTVLFQNKTA